MREASGSSVRILQNTQESADTELAVVPAGKLIKNRAYGKDRQRECETAHRSLLCELADLERRMLRNLQTATRERLHPRNPLTPPAVPLRRQPVPLQVPPIHRPEQRVKDVRETLHHGENRIRQIGAAVATERPRPLRRAAETPQRRTPLSRGSPRRQHLHGGAPGPVVGVDFGGGGVVGRRRGGAQGDGHHVCGDADPGGENGARGGAAVVAVVRRYHGEVDWVVGSGEGVEGAGGELWDFDAVADGSAVATTVDGERVLG